MDWWNDWAEKELNHIRGDVKSAVAYNLTFTTYGNDVWEDVKSSSAATRALLLFVVVVGDWSCWLGRTGARTCWSGSPRGEPRQRPSSGQAVEWSAAVNAGIRVAEMLEFSQKRHPEITGRTDNDSLRLAAERGSSTKFGHLRKAAEVTFNCLKMTQIPMGRVDTSENCACSRKRSLPQSSSISSLTKNVLGVKTATLWILATSCLLCVRAECLKPSHVQFRHRAFRIAEARAEIASAVLLVEIHMTACTICIMCWSPRRLVGACEEAQREDERVGNDLGTVGVDGSAKRQRHPYPRLCSMSRRRGQDAECV